MARLDVWVVVNADGEYVVDSTEDGALDRYADEIGGTSPTRVVCQPLELTLPSVAHLKAVTVPDEE